MQNYLTLDFCPIMDYCAGIWGLADFYKINTIQNRAIHFLLGVHIFAPNLAINADMGWYMSITRRRVDMLRYWNRLQHTNDVRECINGTNIFVKETGVVNRKTKSDNLNMENYCMHDIDVNIDECI